MRSPTPTTGRNSVLEKIWESIAAFSQSLVPGQQRSRVHNPTGSDLTSISRQYDLEIDEIPVRDAEKARHLIEMIRYCPEVATAKEIIRKNCLLSEDGDDFGFAISKKLSDKTPVNPKIYDILTALIETTLSGQTLEPAVTRMLSYGDAFASIGLSKKYDKIERILFLPTWEMFREEDNKGLLLNFAQRRNLSDSNPIRFHPIQIIHWRYQRQNLYGISLFAECLPDWKGLKSSTEDLALACRNLGVNPTIHIMPDHVDEDYRIAYQQAYESRLRQASVTDFYLLNGGDLRKLSNINPDLKAIISTIQLHRSRIAMRSQVPAWMMGLPSDGAREIANQPALFFARHINDIRVCFSTGLRQIFNLELALNGFKKEEWRYRIVYPKIYVDPLERQADPIEAGETNLLGVEDLDE